MIDITDSDIRRDICHIINKHSTKREELYGNELCVWDIAIKEISRYYHIKESTAEEILDAMLEYGDIYEPVLGYLKTV